MSATTQARASKELLNQILKIGDLMPNAFAHSQFARAARDLCKHVPADHLPVHLFQLVESLCEHKFDLIRKVNEAIAKLFQNDRAQAA